MKKFSIAIICYLMAFSSIAQTTAENHEITREIQIDSLELASFMDGVMKTLLEEKSIAGASLLISKDNKILVKKGYGYADINNNIKVDADSTLFRIGSISKLFTWISVMQLVEQGKLDLDTDINEYLEDFKVPDTFEQPITLRSIMSHTPGFEDIIMNLFVKSEEEMQSPEEIFKDQMPKRLWPPLKYASYSNHGTGLAQHIIEKVSNLSLEEYAEKNILTPLGLNNTTFRQPIPTDMMDNMSKGYRLENGVLREKYFEFIPLSGAGAATTTAADMSIFMEALLNKTCFDDTLCLLSDSLYNLMQKPVITPAEGLNSSLLGFMDLSKNGVRIFGHGGDTFWFHSLLAVIPDYNIGLFVTFNSFSAGGLYEKVFNKFINRYFPDNREFPGDVNLDSEYLEKFTGTYKINRHSHTDLFKLLAITNIAEVSLVEDKLKITGMEKEATFWTPIDSLTFINKDNNELIAFEINNGGQADRMFLGKLPIFSFERVEGLFNPDLHLILLLIILFTIVFILFFWPLIALIRRKHQRILPAPQLIPFPAKFVAWIAAACFFIFYLIVFTASSNSGVELIMGIPTSIKIALFLPFLSMPFILLMILQAVILWKMKDVKWRSRLFYYFSILVFIAAIWQLHFWNLLGWNY
ncbi:MAG: serine hydrolase domain-containing protein [Bacteroidales bacterium]